MPGRAYFGFLVCIVALPAIAQPNVPFIYSALNSANYSSTLAQGSLFVVFGMNIGPAQYTGASSLPLPPQLGGTSISVTSGSTTLICPMVYSLLGTAAAILPSNTPTGPATVTLTYKSVMTPFPAQVNVVPSAIGLYTSSSSGLGPGPVTALNGVPKTFVAAAKSSDIVTVWGTGLGPVSGPDARLARPAKYRLWLSRRTASPSGPSSAAIRAAQYCRMVSSIRYRGGSGALSAG